MIRPRPRNVLLASGIMLVSVTGCAGLRRQPPPPMLGPGVVPTPITATAAQPVQTPQTTPFAEPGGGIGRFFPGLYPQIKPQPQTASRWVDPFVARSKKRESTETASIFPQRQPIGLGRPAPVAAESIETLPVALNVPVHPDDDPVQTAETPRWTRRLSARDEPAERPSRWRVSQPRTTADDVETPPEPMPPQAQRTLPPMPEVPRESVAFNLLDAPNPSEAEPPALIDPPVAPASASESVKSPETLGVSEEPEPSAEIPSLDEAPETASLLNLADEPDPLATTPEPLAAEADPFANEPDPLANVPATAAAVGDAEPAKAADSEPAEASESAEIAPKPAEPVNLNELEAPKSAEPEPVTSVETSLSPAAATEPPPLVPTASATPESEPESEPEDGEFAEPPPLSMAPDEIDRSKLPHPPVPALNMTAVPAAPTSDPATQRIATEVTETALKGKLKPKTERPAHRTLWSRIRGEEHDDAPALRDPQLPTPGDGLADMPPPQFLPSYYGQAVTDAKRDEQTRKISTAPKPSAAKPASTPWRFPLVPHLRGR